MIFIISTVGCWSILNVYTLDDFLGVNHSYVRLGHGFVWGTDCARYCSRRVNSSLKNTTFFPLRCLHSNERTYRQKTYS